MSGTTPLSGPLSGPPSGPEYGRSLRGLGFNLIVSDINRAIHFATEVLEATVFFRTDVFAAMKLHGADVMFHIPASYKGNELHNEGVKKLTYHGTPSSAQPDHFSLGKSAKYPKEIHIY